MNWRTALRLALAGLILAGLAAGGLWLRLKVRQGDFIAAQTKFSGPCRIVAGLNGGSDMAVDRIARRVWVSSLDRTKPGARGAIYLMPLDGFEAAPMRIDVTLGKPAAFAPLGLSLWTGPDGAQVLYVVNRPVGGNAGIEVFDVDKSGVLAHRKTIDARGYPRINDVAGAGPDSFYVTVESAFAANSKLAKIARLTMDVTGQVLVWQDGKFRGAAKDLDFANSVALSPDGATLYATATMGQELRIYERNAKSNALHLRERVYLASSPDNIDIAPDGGVWIASHPKFGAFQTYAQNSKVRAAPSQILLVEPDSSGQGGDVHQIYLSAAGPLSGATIGVAEADRLLMGGAFSTDGLACVLPRDFRQDTKHRFISER